MQKPQKSKYFYQDAEQRIKDLYLMEMSRRSNSNIFKIQDLIAEGANPNAQDRSGETALSFAVSRDCIEIALVLIEYTTNVNVLSSTLLSAVNCNRKETLIAPLLKAGANPNFQDIAGNTALHYAAVFH
jgi:ankyrin repeat protein